MLARASHAHRVLGPGGAFPCALDRYLIKGGGRTPPSEIVRRTLEVPKGPLRINVRK